MVKIERSDIEKLNIEGYVSPDSGWNGNILGEAKSNLGSNLIDGVLSKAKDNPNTLNPLEVGVLKILGFTPEEEFGIKK